MTNTKNTIILGIESSCDETAAAIIRARRGTRDTRPSDIEVLANVVSSQIKIHAKYGGVVPEIAARKHVEAIIPVLRKALLTANYSPQTIDAIAVTHGPGLITSLRLGVETAKILSYVFGKPLVPVNHIEGHIYSNWLRPVGVNPKSEIRNPKSIIFPALVLVVSGGHTELVLMNGHGRYEIIGQTRDDAVGEAFDKTAKILGLPYPGGPQISAEAEKFPISNFQFPISLPRPMIDQKGDFSAKGGPAYGWDFSFAGLKTAVLYLVRDLERKGVDIKKLIPQIAYEFQSAAVEVLIAKTVRAAEKYKVKTVLLAGGVSANKKLRKDLGTAIGVMPGVQYAQPSLEYSTDNATMIAAAGYFNYARSPKKFKEMWKKVDVDPNLTI